MAKFNVGVGDAFPVEAQEAQPRDDERRDDEAARGGWCHERRHWRRHRLWYVKVSLVLLVIYGALAAFAGHGPRGLLLAAAIVFGVGFVSSLFRDDDQSPRRHDRERRRSWEDR